MRKKLLTLLLVASTISSTLMPAQSVFADTTGDADVSIVETSSDDQPSTTSGSKRLFQEVDATDYEELGKIPYGEIEYGNKKRKDIKSEVDLDKIKAKTVKDAYPISYEDIYIPEVDISENEEYKTLKDKSKDYFDKWLPTFKYKYNGFHFDFEISEAAKEYINSQQPTYPQESGDCTYNAFTEVADKALIAEDLIHKEDVHKIRMSRAQIEYNGLFVTKDPLDGFHGDYSNEGYSTREVKLDIRRHLSSKSLSDNYDLRRAGKETWIMRSLYSGMGPVKETDVNDARAINLCNNEADVKLPPAEDGTERFVHTKSDNLCTEDVYYTKNGSNKHFAHLTQTRFFSKDPKKTDRNKIKAWIYSYGGVGLTAEYGTTDENDHPQSHYDFEKNCLLRFSDMPTGCHAMTIVGWDDNFPADAFEPDNNGIKINNGAWLVKNSWNPFNQQDLYGTEMTSNKDYAESTPFSFYRYFWLSYDSPAILAYYGLAFENNNYFDNIYQYDGYQENSDYAKSSKAANIFTVKDPDTEPTDDKAQELKCVGFEICNNISSPAKYTIEIYRNIPEGGSPTDGTLINTSTTTGTCPDKGIYTVELKKPVCLANGERYSVVVTLKNGAKIAVEDNRTYTNDALNDARENHCGESFIYSSNKWKDVVDVEPQLTDKWPENVRIKAMTVNTDIDSSTIRATLTPTSPTPAPIADCAELTVKAKVTGSLTGFEYTVETDENSPLADQIKCIRKTITDSKGNKKKSLNYLPDPKIKNGTSSRSVFLPIDPDNYEYTVKIEILDNKNQAVNLHLSSTEANTRSTSYSTSMKEYLNKLKETAVANKDNVTEDFAIAMLIHMTCAQNMYKTKATDENVVDLSPLDSINVADFASYRLKRGTTGNTDGTLPRIGLSFNWKKTNALSVIYYDAEDPSTIKSIQVDGEDITNSNPKEYQFETIDDHHELTVNLSYIPISDFSKTHTITVENTSGRQIIVKASVYSYIYYMLKSKVTDQTTKNYAKSLALLAKSYNQLDMSDTRYKDFFLF
ncbi:MAG: hypothetical protein K5744_12885 [Eubacterium sp.]|nr:hypothetical protein [Eubacterium sp.]